MQSFFHDNEDDERQLTELTNTIFETVVNELGHLSDYLSLTPDVMDSLRDTVYKLVKIASQQNKLLLQFPAVLAYFVYNFLKNIDLDRIKDINEKLDNIQRLIQRKNLQGLSFSTIKQLLQQELQEKKFRRNRPNKAEKQKEEQKQSGKEEKQQEQQKQGGKRSNKVEKQQQEGEKQEEGKEGQESESEESQGQQGQESGEESQEGNEQESGEEQVQQEGGEGNEGEETQQEGQEGGQQSESEGNQEEGEEGESQEGGEGEQGNGEEGEERGNENQGEHGQESGGEEGQQSENEDIIEDLENNIDEESKILDGLQESLQESLTALSIGKGSGGGVLKDINPRVLELLESANRLLALANQVDLQYANRGVKDQGGVMRGITTGNNVKHMFKSQLVLPDEIFLERYTNRALLQRAVENEGVGDLYFMIDKSGSMGNFMPNGYTAFENVSAVALASAMEAEKNSKKVFVQYFDSSSTEPIDVNNVFEVAQTQPGGGTDMMVALQDFMEYYNNYPGLKDVRQIFILSDFETNYDTTLYYFKNFARNNGLVVTCIHVYNDEVPARMQTIIDEICDEYYKFNNYDAGELFSAVYSKI